MFLRNIVELTSVLRITLTCIENSAMDPKVRSYIVGVLILNVLIKRVYCTSEKDSHKMLLSYKARKQSGLYCKSKQVSFKVQGYMQILIALVSMRQANPP